jgi:4'-phosphopantetheinyl transferase
MTPLTLQLAWLDLDLPAAIASLSAGELARADRFVQPEDGARFMSARAQLRAFLGAALLQPPVALVLEADAHGKPFLPAAPALHFNLSHSRNLGLAGMGPVPMGVDIEFNRPLPEDVAGRFFSAEEIGALRALPASAYWRGFYRCWTRKEAFVKALGQGLRLPLDQFSVSITDQPALLSCTFAPEMVRRVQFFDVSPSDELLGSVCVVSDGAPVTLSWRKSPPNVMAAPSA